MSKRYESLHWPAKCPACGSVRVARIEYGLPVFTPELEAKLKAGQVQLFIAPGENLLVDVKTRKYAGKAGISQSSPNHGAS